jgi:SNF2 family DNA or RNA helicase
MVVDVVVVSYEMLQVEADFLKSIQFIYSVFDEVQRLKNRNYDSKSSGRTLFVITSAASLG